MGTAVMGFVLGCMAGAVLSLTACGGGGDVSQAEPAVIVCRAGDHGCRQHAVALKSRACQVMPAGLVVYMNEIHDALLIHELELAGAWTVGNWIEGDDCV